EEHLNSADHVIDVLPAGTDSQKFFSAERFAEMKKSAVFYNIGRGDTVDQPALAAALREDRIAAAYLDVTTPEPLPPDDPLWSATEYLAGFILRLGSNLILARLLVPEMFGLMALVNTFMMGLQMFSDVGIGPSIIQNRRGDDPAFLNTAWTIQVMRGMALSLF